jgi:hypothetical protein
VPTAWEPPICPYAGCWAGVGWVWIEVLGGVLGGVLCLWAEVCATRGDMCSN